MLKRAFSCWLEVVDQEFLSCFVWNHYAAKLDVRVLVFFGWAFDHVLSAVLNRSAGLRFVGIVWCWCSLVFFGLATLNLRVDSCMYEMRFLMLTERLALEFLCRFFWNHFE
jgi:hypothetical protein